MVVHRITVELKNPHGLVVLQRSTRCVCVVTASPVT